MAQRGATSLHYVDPEGGTRIVVDEDGLGDAGVYYASVDERGDGLYTTTSRSYAVVGTGESLAAANNAADAALVDLPDGLRARRDVGSEALLRERSERLDAVRGD